MSFWALFEGRLGAKKASLEKWVPAPSPPEKALGRVFVGDLVCLV